MFIYISASCITVLAKRGIWSFNYSLSCTLFTCPWKHISKFVTSVCIICQVSRLSFYYFLQLFWNVGVKNQFNKVSGYTKERKVINTNKSPQLNLDCADMILGNRTASHPDRWVKLSTFVCVFDTHCPTNLLNSGVSPIPKACPFASCISLVPLPSSQGVQSDTSETSLPPFSP